MRHHDAYSSLLLQAKSWDFEMTRWAFTRSHETPSSIIQAETIQHTNDAQALKSIFLIGRFSSSRQLLTNHNHHNILIFMVSLITDAMENDTLHSHGTERQNFHIVKHADNQFLNSCNLIFWNLHKFSLLVWNHLLWK